MVQTERKLTYSEQLKTIEWKKRRIEIFTRDKYTCQKCGDTKRLQVHHKKYMNGKMAWESFDNHLITLCRSCHEKVHNISPDGKKIPKPKTPKKYLSKNQLKKLQKEKNKKIAFKKKQSLNVGVSEIQKRYNKLRSEGKIP